MPLSQHPRQFVTHTFTRNNSDLTRERLHRGEGSRFDLIFKSRSEAHRPQHAQFVFGNSLLRRTNGTDDSSRQILASSYKIKDLSIDWIEHHPIDGEVSARNVLARILAEAHFIRMPSIRISNITAK